MGMGMGLRCWSGRTYSDFISNQRVSVILSKLPQRTLCAIPGFCRVVCLPATLRWSDDAKTRKESIYETFILTAYMSFDSCYEITAYICSVKMVLCWQHSSKCETLGLECLGEGLGEQRSPLWDYDIKTDVCNVMVHKHMICCHLTHPLCNCFTH